jgi:hypothetical protein
MGDESLFSEVELAAARNASEASFDTTTESLDIALIDDNILEDAQQWVTGCENCAKDTPITFDYVLDAVTGCTPATTEYVMCRPAKCPMCSATITEKTLVLVA